MGLVTISGDLGSGKTTVARQLAERLGYPYISTGTLQREMAAARGIDTLELNRLAETDVEIDRYVDGRLVAFEQTNESAVFESRMAFHFLKRARHVFLYCAEEIAARRILASDRETERYAGIGHAIASIRHRREIEIRRFRNLYHVDIGDLGNYHLILDTSHAAVDQVVSELYAYTAAAEAPARLTAISPRNLIPLGSGGDGAERVAEAFRDVPEPIVSGADPVGVVAVDHRFYLVDGFARASGALQAGAMWIACTVLASDDAPYRAGASARQYVAASLDPALVDAWGQAHGVPVEPDAGAG